MCVCVAKSRPRARTPIFRIRGDTFWGRKGCCEMCFERGHGPGFETNAHDTRASFPTITALMLSGLRNSAS